MIDNTLFSIHVKGGKSFGSAIFAATLNTVWRVGLLSVLVLWFRFLLGV